MGNTITKKKTYQPIEGCDVECQEAKKKDDLYEIMRLNKKLAKGFNSEYLKSRKNYYNHIYGESWINDIKRKEKTNNFIDSYEKKRKKYIKHFNYMTKYYIDSLFLLKNQQEVIKKNKIYSEKLKKELETQKDTIKTLNVNISTANRSNTFSKKENNDLEKSLKKLYYIFYIIITFLIISMIFVITMEVRKRYTKP